MSNLESALRGDWLRWEGLDADLTAGTLLEILGPGTTAEPREPAKLSLQLGTRQAYQRPAPPRRVLAWFEGTSDDVLLVELDDPPSLAPIDQILSTWGAPDRSGPGRGVVLGAMTTEYVYLARGAALTIAESYDDPPLFAPRIARVQLFEPTDLQGFVVRLGGNDRRTGPR